MANGLRVDWSGLNAGAANSELIAAELTVDARAGADNSQPSYRGLSAMDSAVLSARTRQSARVSGQAEVLSAAGVQYEAIDTQTAGGLAELM
ncbi:hypothetical protein ACWDTP_24410 [Mycobacterium sp. NPDC003449]